MIIFQNTQEYEHVAMPMLLPVPCALEGGSGQAWGM